MSFGHFVCPNDGTNDLDFIACYDEDGPCGMMCPVCYDVKLPPLDEAQAIEEAERFLAAAAKGEPWQAA